MAAAKKLALAAKQTGLNYSLLTFEQLKQNLSMATKKLGTVGKLNSNW